MDDPLVSILRQVERGELDATQAAVMLRQRAGQPLGFATVDHDRTTRCGAAEVIFAEHKTPDQVVTVAAAILEQQPENPVSLVTRASPEQVEAIRARFTGTYDVEAGSRSGTVLIGVAPEPEAGVRAIPIVAAGTSDEPVVEEAELTCRAMGQPVLKINDVGVAGLHRLGAQMDKLREAAVIICIAGMEGALPSVIGGLVAVPVIAVPTSVGYGAAFGGIAALLGMLTSCASGVVVVNIDNGFGAAHAASLINRIASDRQCSNG